MQPVAAQTVLTSTLAFACQDWFGTQTHKSFADYLEFTQLRNVEGAAQAIDETIKGL